MPLAGPVSKAVSVPSGPIRVMLPTPPRFSTATGGSSPEARARARADLVELAGLGRGLRSAFLRHAVDDLLTE